MKQRFPAVKKRYSGKPRLLMKELMKWEGEGKTMFVQDCGDLFAEKIPSKYITGVLNHLNQYPKNTYIFQTKNPRRFLEFCGCYPLKSVFGTTIESDIDYGQSQAPSYEARAKVIGDLDTRDKYVTIEPIMSFNLEGLVRLIKIAKPKFVNVGADSKHHGLPEPTALDVRNLIRELKKFTEVRVKDNLGRLGVNEV